MEKYEVLEHVGKGSFGAVTKIRRKSDNKILVWKEISYGKMKEKEKQQLVSEVNILRELRHPNIVKYYDRIIDKANSKIYIVMEYCERGDMGLLIKKCKRENDFLSEDVIWKIFMQVLLALQACHTREAGKILHRDIKPGNVLLDSNMNVKLGDFGLSRILGENSIYAETRVGTPYYMSPEQIADSRYNEKSDIWSAGCLLFEMASLNPPFQAKSHAELAHKINLGHVERIPLRYSEELQRVVSWMLAIDYTRRPNVNEILNLPQILLRVKEKEVRDDTQRIKDLEIKLKEREEKAKNEKEELARREEEICKREKKVGKDKENTKVFRSNSKEKLVEFERERNLEGKNERVLSRERTVEDRGDERKIRNYADGIEKKTEEFYVPEKKFEKASFEGERKIRKENSFEYLGPEPTKEVSRERTFDPHPYEQLLNKHPEKVMKKEKSFENLVQEGLERAKRDNNMLKNIENSKKDLESPHTRANYRPSPSRISHNNSAPDIPRSRVSPSLRESPTSYNMPEYRYGTPERTADQGKIELKKYEKTRPDYEIYKEIEERYKNRNQRARNSPSFGNRESPRYSRENSQEKIEYINQNYFRKDSPSTGKRDSPLVKYQEKHDSPVVRDQYSDYKYQVSPTITKNSPIEHGRYVKNSPNFRRDPEHRRESPRYAEPVRKNNSRGPGYTEGYRKESPTVRTDYIKRNVDSPGLERNNSAERKLQMQKNLTSPGKNFTEKQGEYYKNSPTVRPIPRPKTMENQAKESPRRGEDRSSPHTFENIWKYYGQEGHRAKDAKPPVRRK